MKQVTMAQNIVSYYTERNIHRIRTGKLKKEKKKEEKKRKVLKEN